MTVELCRCESCWRDRWTEAFAPCARCHLPAGMPCTPFYGEQSASGYHGVHVGRRRLAMVLMLILLKLTLPTENPYART